MATIKHPYYTLDWSLGELTDYKTYPYLAPIMLFIEPKIVRGSWLPCWKWNGRHQFFRKGRANETSYPTVLIPKDMTDYRIGRKQWYVHRFMAETFWNIEPGEVVYRKCNHSDCVNPAHFVISYRNDPNYM